MILILISIIVAFGAAGLLLYYGSKEFTWFLMVLAGAVLALASGFAAVSYAFAAWSWFASDYKVSVINREYGTTYTKEEIFWASSVIDTIRELDRKRYEVNGDFRRQQADTKAVRDERSHGTEQRK